MLSPVSDLKPQVHVKLFCWCVSYLSPRISQLTLAYRGVSHGHRPDVLYYYYFVCQTYDPTIEDAYRKQLIVDNRMCFVEVIDTAGQGEHIPLHSVHQHLTSSPEEYATLRDQWVRSVSSASSSRLLYPWSVSLGRVKALSLCIQSHLGQRSIVWRSSVSRCGG